MTGILSAKYEIGPALCGPVAAGTAGMPPERAPAVPVQPSDNLLDQIIEEKRAAVAVQSRAEEIARREAVLAASFEGVLQHHLARECRLPDAETTARHTAVMREFSRWCSKHGVSAMPAKAETAASYILARTLDEGLSTDKAKQIVAGIQFAHDVSERYINSSILKAALAFMAQIDVDEAATVAESVAELELPKTNGNGSHE
jgi:hypothetical protein